VTAGGLDREMLAQVRRIQVRTDRMVTDVMAGGYTSVFRGSGIEFDEVREFTEGDDLRAIDWNVTARQGRPFVKKFMEERELSVLFLLDVSGSMHFGTTGRSVRETAALFAGCIAFAAARNNDKAGLVAFSDRIERYVPCKKGKNHVLRLIREAYAAEHEGTATDFAVALDYAGRVQRKHAVVFVISDFLAPCPDKALRLLSRRHDVIAVRLRDERSEVLPKAGLLRLRDLETGAARWIDTGSRRVQQALVEKVAAERAAFAEQCLRAKVDLLDLPARGSVGDAIVRFFRMRELRGGRR
jgi:uncharacterized protein (DUF58 family)